MHCPNCGAQNKKRQNYCRYCGMHLPDVEKLFLSQLVFGEDTKRLKRLRSARKLIGYVQIFLVILLGWGLFRLFTTDFDGGKDLVRLSVVSFAILLAVDWILGYFQRQSLKTNRRNVVSDDGQKEIEARETAKLIEEKPFSPISNFTETSTESLFVNRKADEVK